MYMLIMFNVGNDVCMTQAMEPKGMHISVLLAKFNLGGKASDWGLGEGHLPPPPPPCPRHCMDRL